MFFYQCIKEIAWEKLNTIKLYKSLYLFLLLLFSYKQEVQKHMKSLLNVLMVWKFFLHLNVMLLSYDSSIVMTMN